MEKHYRLYEIAHWFKLDYSTVYATFKSRNVRVIRSGVKSNNVLHVAHADVAELLLAVDWIMCPTCQTDHPFTEERQTFERLYIQRIDLAQQLNYSELYIRTWGNVYGFPSPVVRGGWYKRTTVLCWLQLHKPIIYHRINGTLY